MKTGKKLGRPPLSSARYGLEMRKVINTTALLKELESIALGHTKKNDIDVNGNVIKIKVYDYAVNFRLEAIKILVNKTLPDLKSVEMNVNEGATQLDYAAIAIAVNAIREAGLIDITPPNENNQATELCSVGMTAGSANEEQAPAPLPEPPLPQGDGNFV